MAKPCIKATYFICEGGERTSTTKIFDLSHSKASEVRVGLPIGVAPVKPKPGDEAYSGMHDQGALPELKEGGPLTVMIGLTDLAKEYNNDFMTKKIDEAKKSKVQVENSTPQLDSPNTSAKKSSALPNKRPKPT